MWFSMVIEDGSSPGCFLARKSLCHYNDKWVYRGAVIVIFTGIELPTWNFTWSAGASAACKTQLCSFNAIGHAHRDDTQHATGPQLNRLNIFILVLCYLEYVFKPLIFVMTPAYPGKHYADCASGDVDCVGHHFANNVAFKQPSLWPLM